MKIIGVTDRGRARASNQDAVATDPALGIAVLADGMGGLQQGELAARTAVAALIGRLRIALPGGAEPLDGTALAAEMQQVNRELWALSQARRPPVTMGTTVVASVVQPDGRSLVAHAGDSRAYLRDANGLRQITRDHSLVQDLVDAGSLDAAAARIDRRRNIVTRALGLEPAIEVPWRSFRMSPGDLLLLCSDGLWDMLPDDRIAALLGPHGTAVGDPAGSAAALIDAANEAGGDDNIAVVLVCL